MATPRVPSFYSTFFRAVRACEPKTYQSIRTRPPPRLRPTRRIHSSSRTDQQVQQRYGTAVSPELPPPPKPSEQPREARKAQPPKKETAKEVENEDKKTDVAVTKEIREAAQAKAEAVMQETVPPEEATDRAVEQVKAEADQWKGASGTADNKELNEVLSIPAPSEVKAESSKHPHLEAPPYEHHFDTYSLVQQLSTGGLTWSQSVTIMKAVRSMLAINLDVAKESLVSKSDIENESYLFRAACSELRTTLQTNRLSETQKMRSQRAHLQHDYEILNQKLSQDLGTMREDLKSQFNDRKMGLEEEKRRIDGKISELNYEITVLLNSEAKSEVEGLRWVLTRRAAMAIAIAAIMVLSSLNYSSIKTKEKEEQERKRKAANKVHEEREARLNAQAPGRSQGTQTEGGSMSSFEESLG